MKPTSMIILCLAAPACGPANYDGLGVAPAPVHGLTFSPNDVAQGPLNDCWVVANLASLAANHPEILAQDIDVIDADTYHVTLLTGEGGEWVSEIVTTADIAALRGRSESDKTSWPAAFEVAIGRHIALDTPNTPGIPLRMLLGAHATIDVVATKAPLPTQLIPLGVSACTGPHASSGWEANHCYSFISAAGQGVTLRDPWGGSDAYRLVSLAAFIQNIQEYFVYAP